ncbi:5-methylcytosine-specific restriction enzyme B [Limihaloglobus sulfuriphilus]|uniref:5-methylcytosine-specific restriction enzyme B n=1 Tax=Limihaloglobus sulfuriphilus TaxID=1851148 RepID=A0A1Q2MB78_9BACT|nr:AAA family ATPase [Limihaloglobus sulfuriphilus]AQQ69946.1 5-methylcytosine-specific restriction enzyme B [Limihaloglobus sulfuriphilus]
MTETAENNQQPEYLKWADFYTEFSTKLLPYRNKRKELIDELKRLSEEIPLLTYLNKDQLSDGSKGFVRDICPFTFIATFNRGGTNKNRLEIAGRLAEFLGVTSALPDNLEVGVPTLDSRRSWFFSNEKSRKPDDINSLWSIFSNAIEFADGGSEESRLEFVDAYEKALQVRNTGWNLTMGLFWTRPQHFVNLDTPNQEYIFSRLTPEGKKSKWEKQLKTGKGYLELRDLLLERFKDSDFPAHSFPELSYKAWIAKTENPEPQPSYDRPYWFVGAVIDNQDFTDKFVNEGIWRHGFNEGSNIDKVYSIQAGDRIAIKSTYTRKNNIPFDNYGQTVSVMAIKAIGTVIENIGDGQNIKVDWTPVQPVREWYFYTFMPTIWEVYPHNWHAKQLIEFTFQYKEQDIKRFKNDSYWRDRFGDHLKDKISPVEPYTLEMAMDGLFMGEDTFTNIVSLLEAKKNVILQGAPGVGKTFIARRLAYYLMGVEDDSRAAMIQFHQSYSYEDFIQGYRPDEGGNFVLQNGVFYNFCERARQRPDQKHVFIIDEINRGNLSKIFGELMMLIESDKRGDKFAIPLTYGKNGEKFSIPENVYLLGTMNTADRSLAMVDYALRRRFAFITLEPYFTSKKFAIFLAGKGVSGAITESIKLAMQSLNEEIRKESRTLGEGFCIGHSFFCPEQPPADEKLWLERIFNHEIKPLIDEYWFDNPDKADKMKQLLNPKKGSVQDGRAQ